MSAEMGRRDRRAATAASKSLRAELDGLEIRVGLHDGDRMNSPELSEYVVNFLDRSLWELHEDIAARPSRGRAAQVLGRVAGRRRRDETVARQQKADAAEVSLRGLLGFVGALKAGSGDVTLGDSTLVANQWFPAQGPGEGGSGHRDWAQPILSTSLTLSDGRDGVVAVTSVRGEGTSPSPEDRAPDTVLPEDDAQNQIVDWAQRVGTLLVNSSLLIHTKASKVYRDGFFSTFKVLPDTSVQQLYPNYSPQPAPQPAA